MEQPDARVVLVGLGGTIAMAADAEGGAVPALSTEQLVAAVPGPAETGVAVEAADLRHAPGASLGFADVAALAETVEAHLAGGAAGVVATQGTDTIEESSYLLDLWYQGQAPVVVTGAMRPSSLAGADGPANLLAALRTAADPRVRGQGVLVVAAEEIHAARRVRKTHTTSPTTFRSPDGGPLGHVVEGVPHLLNRLGSRFTVPRPEGGGTPPRVGLITLGMGDDGVILEAAAPHCDGLVVAAMGAGHAPEETVAPLRRIAERIPVVLASRTGSGPVLSATYGFPGSERDLLRGGLIRAGFLGPAKARILLYSLLAAGSDRESVAAAFGAAGGCAPEHTWPFPAAGAGTGRTP